MPIVANVVVNISGYFMFSIFFVKLLWCPSCLDPSSYFLSNSPTAAFTDGRGTRQRKQLHNASPSFFVHTSVSHVYTKGLAQDQEAATTNLVGFDWLPDRTKIKMLALFKE